jgi:hypothetical protein
MISTLDIVPNQPNGAKSHFSCAETKHTIILYFFVVFRMESKELRAEAAALQAVRTSLERLNDTLLCSLYMPLRVSSLLR